MAPLDDYTYRDEPDEVALNRCDRADIEQAKKLQRQRFVFYGLVITNLRANIAIHERVD